MEKEKKKFKWWELILGTIVAILVALIQDEK